MNTARSNRYFRSICQMICDDRFGKSYRKLFEYLHSRDFYWSVLMDRNRAIDGVALRERYGCDNDLLGEPCSVLEMLIALSTRMENLTHDYDSGDRTSQWFWLMLTNLGLNCMDDDNFDEGAAEWIVNRFLDREYEYDGSEGGLFVLAQPYGDLREVEIWVQMNWFLSERDGY